ITLKSSISLPPVLETVRSRRFESSVCPLSARHLSMIAPHPAYFQTPSDNTSIFHGSHRRAENGVHRADPLPTGGSLCCLSVSCTNFSPSSRATALSPHDVPATKGGLRAKPIKVAYPASGVSDTLRSTASPISCHVNGLSNLSGVK